MNDFGKYLKRVREEKGLTINQLAIYSGVSSASISRIENGQRGVPKPITINKLSDALKISYEELMKAAGYIDSTNNPDNKEKDDNPISVSFRDGGKNLTPEEEEYLEQQLQQFREWRKRFQKD